MGQYYKPFIESKDGELISYDNPSMLKLTEHSYYGNEVVLGMYEVLYNNPVHVAWVGDYATDYDFNDPSCKFDKDLVLKAYKQTWEYNSDTEEYLYGDKELPSVDTNSYIKKDNDKWTVTDDRYYGIFDEYKLLVNHTKKEFINLHKYFYNNKKYYNYEGPYFNPLPILTAVGNGFGGGDYHYSNSVNKEMVGYWFYDVISVEDKNYKVPEDYIDQTENEDYVFYEK